MIIQHIDTVFYFPLFLYIYKNNKEVGRLIFYIVLSCLSFNEFIDKKMYYFQYNDLNKYNYIGEKCRILVTQYFLTDIFFISNKEYLFHHFLILFGLSWSYYFSKGYYLILYLSLNEISSIFLAFKNLNIYSKYSNFFFIITFIIFRILLLPILTYIYSYHNLIFIILLLDDCLHSYWVIMLFRKILIK